ncbi:MAG: DUF1330 domain-containing protein [Lewinellaceae bacterium]|nr:DUF1330 domain-containing protein [Saprospiraceae bacterium]MCB9315627.1 DUF1330 domain-containing protein [Lewinellaceae bacterium]MCB9332081.1 DUF1330 domain-containing protein [Lewinellaceae bacterium]
MIYLTQLIFVEPGKEQIFHQFEDLAIPLMERYRGRILYRLRPTPETYVSGDADKPYEIHFISFDTENDLENFLKDDRRQEFMHLKNASVRKVLLVKGAKM